MITTLIGSGLVIFLLNNIAADINQPSINLNIVSDNINNNIPKHSVNETGQNITKTTTKYETIIINNGRTPATNLIVRLYYPNGMISNFSSNIQSENVVFKKPTPSLLVAETNRLSTDSIISITTNVVCNSDFNKIKNESILSYNIGLGNITSLNCPPVNYFITDSYDQGSSFATNLDSSFIDINKFNSFHSREQILTIILTIAIIFFIVSLLYKRIKRFKKRLYKPKFVFEIAKEIISIRDLLNENINSKRIIPTYIWYSKDEEEKWKIFNDYDDYYYLEDFYTKLKERANLMSRKNQHIETEGAATSDNKDMNIDSQDFEPKKIIMGDKNTPKEINKECLILANNAISNINWKDYQDTADKKYYKPLGIVITIACAILVSISFESYRLIFFHFTIGIPIFSYRITFVLITTIIRSLIYFILAKEIINFMTLFAYEVGNNNNVLSFTILDKSSQFKLLLLSAIFGGIPVTALLTNFDFIQEEIQLFANDSTTGYLYFIGGISTDVAMFLILISIMHLFVLKSKTYQM